MSLVIRSAKEMQAWRSLQGSANLGFVPTMGALHQGHEELLIQARKTNQFVVLSLFVNPTQFNNSEDFKNYPITWEADLKMAEKNKVDVIFSPTKDDLYPDAYKYKVTESELSTILCGQHRPGHFDGVLTVVMKLFQIVKPTYAYFGEKDFQQLKLIEDMVRAFFLDTQIVPIPTVRETDGLAMSSRNMRLSEQGRKKAPLLYKHLTHSRSTTEAAQKLLQDGFEIDYVQDIDSRRFAAVHLGAVRLIDNVKI